MAFSKPVAGFAQRSRWRVNDCASRLQRATRKVASPANPSCCQARSHPRAWGMPLMTDRIKDFLARNREDGPRLVVDLDVVRENYLGFASGAAGHARVLRRQGQSGARDSRSAGAARLVLRHRLGGRDRAGAGRRRDARPHQLRQHDQEGEGHRARLCARRPPVRRGLRGRGREDRARRAGLEGVLPHPVRRRGRGMAAVAQVRLRAGNGGARARARASRSASSPTASRSMSARSSAIRACGTAR